MEFRVGIDWNGDGYVSRRGRPGSWVILPDEPNQAAQDVFNNTDDVVGAFEGLLGDYDREFAGLSSRKFIRLEQNRYIYFGGARTGVSTYASEYYLPASTTATFTVWARGGGKTNKVDAMTFTPRISTRPTASGAITTLTTGAAVSLDPYRWTKISLSFTTGGSPVYVLPAVFTTAGASQYRFDAEFVGWMLTDGGVDDFSLEDSENITEDVLTLEWMLGSEGGDRVSEVATALIVLKNDSERYIPNNTNSDLFGMMKPRRRVIIEFYDPDKSLWRVAWCGFVKNYEVISNDIRAKLCRVECELDPFFLKYNTAELPAGETPITPYTSKQLMDMTVSKSGWNTPLYPGAFRVGVATLGNQTILDGTDRVVSSDVVSYLRDTKDRDFTLPPDLWQYGAQPSIQFVGKEYDMEYAEFLDALVLSEWGWLGTARNGRLIFKNRFANRPGSVDYSSRMIGSKEIADLPTLQAQVDLANVTLTLTSCTAEVEDNPTQYNNSAILADTSVGWILEMLDMGAYTECRPPIGSTTAYVYYQTDHTSGMTLGAYSSGAVSGTSTAVTTVSTGIYRLSVTIDTIVEYTGVYLRLYDGTGGTYVRVLGAYILDDSEHADPEYVRSLNLNNVATEFKAGFSPAMYNDVEVDYLEAFWTVRGCDIVPEPEPTDATNDDEANEPVYWGTRTGVPPGIRRAMIRRLDKLHVWYPYNSYYAYLFGHDVNKPPDVDPSTAYGLGTINENAAIYDYDVDKTEITSIQGYDLAEVFGEVESAMTVTPGGSYVWTRDQWRIRGENSDTLRLRFINKEAVDVDFSLTTLRARAYIVGDRKRSRAVNYTSVINYDTVMAYAIERTLFTKRAQADDLAELISNDYGTAVVSVQEFVTVTGDDHSDVFRFFAETEVMTPVKLTEGFSRLDDQLHVITGQRHVLQNNVLRSVYYTVDASQFRHANAIVDGTINTIGDEYGVYGL